VNKHDADKLMHERIVIQEFLELYNEMNDTDIVFIRHGDPLKKEPDAVCSENMYIEMVDMFPHNSEVAERWSRIRHEKRGTNLNLVLNTNERIQELIYLKSQKLDNGYYDGVLPGSKIVLLCNVDSSAISDHEVVSFIDYFYPLSKDHIFKRYFDEVWLMWKPSFSTVKHIKKIEI
jgi:hypothetical protein